MLEDAIRGAFSSLDPYSFYYSADEMAAMFEQTSGEYYGIGVLVTMDGEGGIAILRIYDGPARDADLREGDRIVAIDGTALSVNTSADLTAATAMIKAETQTPVLLTIERDGEVLMWKCSAHRWKPTVRGTPFWKMGLDTWKSANSSAMTLRVRARRWTILWRAA